MTKAEIDPGICGLRTVLEAKTIASRRYSVGVRSDCPMVQSLDQDLTDIDLKSLFQKVTDNPMYRAASEKLRHASCPVVPAILKVLEVEAQLALARDVHVSITANCNATDVGSAKK